MIAVHGVQDPAFMQRALDGMNHKLDEGGVDRECWAQVSDRVLVQAGRLQRFGTQLRSEVVDGQRRWGVAPLEDPAGLLERPAAVGLGDYDEYLGRQRQDYRIPDGVPPFPDEPQWRGDRGGERAEVGAVGGEG